MSSEQFRIRLLGGEWGTQMSCQEANCAAYREGWVTVLDTLDTQMVGAANWIKNYSGRQFFEWSGWDALEAAYQQQSLGRLTVTPELQAMLSGLAPQMAVFYFVPHQQCFKEHLDREVKFFHGGREHSRPLDFNEDYNEAAYRANLAKQRG